MAEVLGILDTESDDAGVRGTEEGTSLKKELIFCCMNSFLCQQSIYLGRRERTGRLMLGPGDRTSDDQGFTVHVSGNLIPLWKCGRLRDQ